MVLPAGQAGSLPVDSERKQESLCASYIVFIFFNIMSYNSYGFTSIENSYIGKVIFHGLVLHLVGGSSWSLLDGGQCLLRGLELKDRDLRLTAAWVETPWVSGTSILICICTHPRVHVLLIWRALLQ